MSKAVHNDSNIVYTERRGGFSEMVNGVTNNRIRDFEKVRHESDRQKQNCFNIVSIVTTSR